MPLGPGHHTQRKGRRELCNCFGRADPRTGPFSDGRVVSLRANKQKTALCAGLIGLLFPHPGADSVQDRLGEILKDRALVYRDQDLGRHTRQKLEVLFGRI